MNEAQLTELPDNLSLTQTYDHLLETARNLIGEETNLTANCANVCALLYHTLPDINWLGVYFFDGEELVVGPFQGKPACARIPLGKGVCGTSAINGNTIVVRDVHSFEGHIACDVNSRSEIVVPMLYDDELIGVLDVDSPSIGRFGEVERDFFEKIVHLIVYASAESLHSETI